jgi:hypothetical protein
MGKPGLFTAEDAEVAEEFNLKTGFKFFSATSAISAVRLNFLD